MWSWRPIHFFLNAVKNSLVFTAWSVPTGMVVALAAALLLDRPRTGIGLFRTVYYIPSICSQVAISMIWIWVLLPDAGLVNWLLGWVNLAGVSVAGREFFDTNVNYLDAYAMASVVVLSIWIGLGPRMVIFLAGLQSIPASLYEAAEVDGAGTWQRFRHVTLPMLAPTTFFVLVTSTIASLQLFTPIYVMTQGGPSRSTDVVVYHIYKEAWHKFHIGRSSAMSYVLFFIILAVALLQFWAMKRRSEAAVEIG
jgi:multiple sugar transport system permease protein